MSEPAPSAPTPTLYLRAATALVQAVALYLLTESAMTPRCWPATNRLVFLPLVTVTIFVPTLLQLGLGQIRPRPLALWAAAAAALAAALAYFHAARGLGQFDSASVIFWFALVLLFFIAQALVTDSIIANSLTPPYDLHFDTAWKQAIRALLTWVFVGVFWGVLELGAGLFQLVNLDFLEKLIRHLWFAYPATTLAIAASIHLTDVQPALIRGARTLALTLFSWLLPMLSLLLLGFLVSLPFISLTPLWNTHFAAVLLLTAAILLIFFINCCYQDGAPERLASRVKTYASMLGAVELLPLTALSAWAILLRVDQYGWTAERIFSTAITSLTACYAVGYASNVISRRPALKRIEITNLIAAYVAVLIIVALFTPIADPARLMVASQVARLESGAVSPDKFDFYALKYQGAKWGKAALVRLAQDKTLPNAAAINAAAAQALNAGSRYAYGEGGRLNPSQTITDAASHITLYPAGATLPPGFATAAADPYGTGVAPICMRSGTQKCLARIITLTPTGPAAILFDTGGQFILFQQPTPGIWLETASLTELFDCPPVKNAIAAGNFTVTPHPFPDITINGVPAVLIPKLNTNACAR